MRELRMLSAQQLSAAVKRLIAHASRPPKVIIFGSYGRGDATEQSDLDLMVIQPELPDKAAEYLRLKEAVGRLGVGVDLLLFSEREYERRSQVPGTAPYWAKKEGRVLHEPTA